MDKGSMFLVAGMLVTGTINTLSKKWQNQQMSRGIDGQEKLFQFPWSQTLVMYCGEAICMIVFLIMMKKNQDDIRGRAEEREINQTEKALLMSNETEEVEKKNWKTPFLFLIASSLDLIGTTLAGIGLLYTSASVFQMLRGSIIIFSGILSVIFLKRKLYAYNWFGIFITTCGLAAVGTASLLTASSSGSSSSSGKSMLYGNLLVIAGQFANAIQFIVEEIFLKKKKFSPLLVVGAEGCWGIVLMCSIALPIVYAIPGSDDGHYENAIDAAVMVGNNMRLLGFILLYWVSIAFYNFFGLSVAKKLTAVHRTFIDAVRTIFVWAIDLILYYALKGITGEEWTRYSYVELGGFFLLVIGTATYNTTLKYPFFKYPVKL